jgi:hypothetical protein
MHFSMVLHTNERMMQGQIPNGGVDMKKGATEAAP